MLQEPYSSASATTDRVFGVLMVLFSIIYLYFASQLPVPFSGSEIIGPKTFPIILGSIMVISGIWLAIKPQPGESWPVAKVCVELVLIIISLIIFVLGLETIGFIPMSILSAGFLSWRMGASLSKAYIIAAIYCIGLFILFDVLLDLSLPLGIFGSLFEGMSS